MKRLLFIITIFPSIAFAQIDTSMYNTGGARPYYFPQRPMYVAPMPQPAMQPIVQPNDPRSVFMNAPQPTQRACALRGGTLICN